MAITVASLARARGVLWDLDGLIVDTEPAHRKTLEITLAEVGIEISEKEYFEEAVVRGERRNPLIVFSDEDALKEVFWRAERALDVVTLRRLMAFKAEAYLGLMPSIELFPGAHRLMEKFSDLSAPQLIVSGSLRSEISGIAVAKGIFGLLSGFVGAEDTDLHKPDPEPYLAALDLIRTRRTDLQAGECVGFEDSAGGIRAGKAAGLFMVGATNSAPAEKLLEAGADIVVDSLTEVIYLF